MGSPYHQTGLDWRRKNILERFEFIPIAGAIGSFDLDHFVITKAVDELFSRPGEEERFMNDRATRDTELLCKVLADNSH